MAEDAAERRGSRRARSDGAADAERRARRPSSRSGTGRTADAAVRHRPLWAWLLFAAVLAVAGWVFHDGWRFLSADLTSMRARWQVGQWISGAEKPPGDAAWNEARRALERAVAITPDDPVLHDRLGDLHAVAGARDWDDEDRSVASYERAVTHYKAALALRPLDPQTWASLAAAYTGTGERGAPFHEAWATAQRLGPHEGHVQPMLMSLAMSNWSEASPAMREWVRRLHADAAGPQRKALEKVATRYGLRFDDAGMPQLLTPPPEQGVPAESLSKAAGSPAVTDTTNGNPRP